MTSDDPQDRQPPATRDQAAAGERADAEARAQRRSPAHRAERAVASLREITTISGYTEAPELYAVLNRLRQVTDMTEQVVDQAREWLATEHRAGRIGTDDAGDVPATLDALTAARVQARTYSTALDTAAGHVGHLIGPDASAG